MTRAIVATLAVVVVVLASACGGGGDSSPAANGDGRVTTTTESAPDAAEPSTATSTTGGGTGSDALDRANSSITTPPPQPPVPDAAPPAAELVHRFPLDPASSGSYSAGGHAYPATDIFTPAGTAFVALTSGTIQGVSRVDEYDPAVDDPALRSGLFVSLVGDDGVRYYGSHLREVAPGIEAGVRVEAGQLLGRVGTSGNAAGTAPHLHFGISRPTPLDDWATRRGEVDPIPYLDAWRSGDTGATPILP